MPPLHQVIPYMDCLTASLDDFHANPDLNPVVCIAVGRGRAVLYKFYGLIDDSQIFRIAMHKFLWPAFLCKLADPMYGVVLHPHYKTVYFCCNRWPQLWIDAALSLV